MKLRLIESLGSLEYTPPNDDQKLMADFYTLQHLLSVQDKPEYSKELKFDLKHVCDELLPYLKNRLLEFGLYAIMCEGEHCFDTLNVKSGTPEWWENHPYGYANYNLLDDLKETSKHLMVKYGISDSIINLLSSGNLRPPDFLGIKGDDDAEVGSGPSRQAILPGLKGDAYDIVSGLQKMFALDGWKPKYGGKPWTMCCNAWLNLYQSESTNEIITAIDLMYSAQHNTGAFLNKNSEFQGTWVKQLLDLKFESNSADDLLKYASNYVKQLALKFIGLERRGYNGQMDNSLPSKSNLSITETVIKSLEKLGCNIYDDKCFVDVPSYTGFVDINFGNAVSYRNRFIGGVSYSIPRVFINLTLLKSESITSEFVNILNSNQYKYLLSMIVDHCAKQHPVGKLPNILSGIDILHDEVSPTLLIEGSNLYLCDSFRIISIDKFKSDILARYMINSTNKSIGLPDDINVDNVTKGGLRNNINHNHTEPGYNHALDDPDFDELDEDEYNELERAILKNIKKHGTGK